MDAFDELICDFYRAASGDAWQEYRARSLAHLCDVIGAGGAAWWTRAPGAGAGHGELTQTPQMPVDPAQLAALPLPPGREATISDVAVGRGRLLAVQCPHRDGILLSTLVIHFEPGRKPPAETSLLRVVCHLVRAASLCLQQFIRRDDWLHAMGRTSRGSAALVDADGAIHAASERFFGLIGDDGSTRPARLPFDLPEETLGDEGGEFVHGSLHLRVSRVAPLYLIYARQPLPLDSLSPREQEIARALGDGKTLKSIARQYGIAVSTVANHTTRIYRKLAIYRREDLIELVRKRPEPGR